MSVVSMYYTEAGRHVSGEFNATTCGIGMKEVTEGGTLLVVPIQSFTFC